MLLFKIFLSMDNNIIIMIKTSILVQFWDASTRHQYFKTLVSYFKSVAGCVADFVSGTKIFAYCLIKKISLFYKFLFAFWQKRKHTYKQGIYFYFAMFGSLGFFFNIYIYTHLSVIWWMIEIIFVFLWSLIPYLHANVLFRNISLSQISCEHKITFQLSKAEQNSTLMWFFCPLQEKACCFILHSFRGVQAIVMRAGI